MENNKPTNDGGKVYLLCDFYDKRAAEISGAPHIGAEFMGICSGRVVHESGEVIGRYSSSSFGWLRKDLLSSLPKGHDYEVVDLIGQQVPEQYALPKARSEDGE